MKKVIFTLSIFGALAINATAQLCSPNTVSCTPPPVSGTPGLSPTSEGLPCVPQGVAITPVIINFENYTVAPIVGNITTLEITEISNLPAGLCWASSKPNNTFGPGETGCIQVTGTTNAPAGQYKLTIKVKPNGLLVVDAEAVLNLRYYVRVNDNGAGFGLDTVAGKTSAFIAKASLPAGSCTPTSGINDINTNISALSINPNPMHTSATLVFDSKISGNATVSMTSILGTVVSSKNIEINAGTNNVSIDRNSAAPGIYFVNISSKNGRISRKVIID